MKLSKFSAVLILIVAALVVTAIVSLAAPPVPPTPKSDMGIIVGYDSHHDVSPPLRDIPPVVNKPGKGDREANENPRVLKLDDLEQHVDPVVQRLMSPLAMPAPIANFDGQANLCGCLPPDTNGEVGPNHFVQTVNVHLQIWNKSGTSLYGPSTINTLWSGFGGACQTNNDGDPVVLYDQLADRWLISQFTASSPYNECIAISQTADPTGAYYRYAFQLSTTDFPDYPHLGVWPDGYYMSENWFIGGASYGGPRPYVFDRARMLQGLSATFQTTTGALGSGVAPILPSDLDGSTVPPTGAPNYFLGTPSTGGTLPIYKFHVDWTTPANTTFTGPTNVAGASYTALCPTTRSCVPQSGTTARLDGIGDRMMFRAAYRNFGDHEALVGNLSVSSGGVAGVRWYELRNLNGTPSIFQQGTYQPDTTYRWMGSAAMDRNGNLAIGFSASSSSINPQIRYAGRLASDPSGQLSQGEATLFAGTSSQTSTSSRWGDYSDITVDPVDDCTFWYTTEYVSSGNWRTRIGSFKFPSCTTGPTPTPGPSNTPGPTSTFTPTPTRTNTPAPSNDDFNSATTIGSLPFTGTANTSAYTTATDDPAVCAGSPVTGGHSAWYKYTPGASQTLNLDTLTSNYDTVLSVFTGTRGALTRLACNDDSNGGLQSQITNFAATGGTTYYIEIVSYGTGAGGSLVLHLSSVGGPTATNTPPPATATNTPPPATATNTPPAPTATPGGNVVVNPGFESGPGVGWSEFSSGGFEIVTTTRPHTGLYSAYECGYNLCTEYVQQTITVPSNGTLTYWWWMSSSEGTTTAYDFMYVRLYSTNGTLLTTLRTWSNRNTRNTWQQDTLSLSAYAGQTVNLRFTSTTDSSLISTFFVDDVSVR